MAHLPRLALGTVQPNVSSECLVWGLLAVLRQAGFAVQAFQSRCQHAPQDTAKIITGRPERHLDSWVMSRSICRESFLRGCESANFAVVSGSFLNSPKSMPLGSQLSELCAWLGFPKLALLDVSRLKRCQLPAKPPGVEAVLLDQVANRQQGAIHQTNLEALWGVPVLGYLGEIPQLRAEVQNLPADVSPTAELCEALRQQLSQALDWASLETLAERATTVPDNPNQERLSWKRQYWGEPRHSGQEPSASWLSDLAAEESADEGFAVQSLPQQPLRIAVASDEAFSRFFPDTLDRLEGAGVTLCDFSPLRSEALPADVDMIYFGGGPLQRHLAQLSANHCLQQSLRVFAASGGRIYAQGSGLGYLCRQVLLPDGSAVPMTGLLPATAKYLPHANPSPQPVEFLSGASCWLFPIGSSVRGYRQADWEFIPNGAVHTFAGPGGEKCDLVGKGNVVASRLMVNFSAQPQLLRRWLAPYDLASLLARTSAG